MMTAVHHNVNSQTLLFISFDFLFPDFDCFGLNGCSTACSMLNIVTIVLFKTKTHTQFSAHKQGNRHVYAGLSAIFDKNANAHTSKWLRYGIEDLCSFMGKREKEIIILDQWNYY